MVSTNGGGSFSNLIVLAAGATTLRAVAYTGNGFLVAGDGGLILSSADGFNWKPENSPSTSDFYAISFANSNQLQTLGVLVGTAGRAVIAGTPPPAPINAISATNCANMPTNPPLSVTLVTNADFPSGTVVVD